MTKQKKTLYKCPECGLEYIDKAWADKCQAWCSQYKSCNLEIIKYAVQKEGGEK